MRILHVINSLDVAGASCIICIIRTTIAYLEKVYSQTEES